MTTFVKLVEENLLYGILTVTWLLFLWVYYLSYRQKALVTRLVELPQSVEKIMTKDVYDKSRSYYLDKLNFSDFKEFYSELFTTAFLLTFGYYYFWSWSIDLMKYFGFNEKNEYLVSVVCMFLINVLHDIIFLPLKIYSTFVVEQKHGFNKETPALFIKDRLLMFVIREVITEPILCAIIWIIKNGGDYFFFYVWIFLIIVSVFMMILYPEVIAPLFDTYTPLPEGDLKKKIEALAASINYPLYKIFLVNKSKRSSHSNAYLYGFYKHKRIVLFDTLVKEYYKPPEGETEIKGCETDEVLAVLAHELGHWKYNHTLKGFVLGLMGFMLNLFLYAKLLNYEPMYRAFGFMDSQPIFIGLIIVTMYILIPLNILLNFLSVVVARRFEFEADRFAKIVGHGGALKSSLIKLGVDNLGYPLYDKLFSGWHHNHPSILERLEAMDKED
ncbi:CAAX prenyl protease 1 homolog [Osmia bicornis bicornis]|uniref:CAAX prenyl protease 1 homolog n=1 Tax=Osmia bicornis bicornis TaxID=1437191 RepID=UPI0010F65ACB|nr:CAAX prenyl protease 1 homolog [Osmia bicornis bicornis]